MWLHVPNCEPSPSAPASEGSTSPPPSLRAEELAQSATWKGKSRQPSYWRRLSKRATYTKHLCGVTSEPSMLDRGVESWIASLRATPASPSAAPASGEVKTTLDIFGPQYVRCFELWVLLWRFSRTSLVMLDEGSTPSSETCKKMATELRSRFQEHRTWVLRIVESASSSSQWPTPCARDSKGPYINKRQGGRDLPRAVLMWTGGQAWPAPVASDCRSSGRATTTAEAMHPGTSLTDAIRAWLKNSLAGMGLLPTPTATSYGSNKGGRMWHVDKNRSQKIRYSLDAMASRGLLPSLQPSTTPPDGKSTSDDSPVLSPLFDEALMGFPIMWTAEPSPEPTE